MDWLLCLTTLWTTCALGWHKGSRGAWLLLAANNLAWLFYAVAIRQFGLVPLATGLTVAALISAWRVKRPLTWDEQRAAHMRQKYEEAIAKYQEEDTKDLEAESGG